MRWVRFTFHLHAVIPGSPVSFGKTLAIHVAEQTRTVRPPIGLRHTHSVTFDNVPRHPDLVAPGLAATVSMRPNSCAEP